MDGNFLSKLKRSRPVKDGTGRGIVPNQTLAFIIKRLLQALLTLLIASLLSYVIVQLAPGNYVDSLRENLQNDPELIDRLEQQFGLAGEPASPIESLDNLKSFLGSIGPWLGWVIPSYFKWLAQVLQGNLGESFVFKRPVAGLLTERVGATLLLALSSLVLTWAIAVPMGVTAAVNQNKWSDRLLRSLSYLGQGFPSFITALLLLILAQRVTPLLPVGDMTSINYADMSWLGKILDVAWHMILPTIALSVASFAGLQRITRGELLEVLRQDYVRTARAKGLPENRVIYRHALRNAINPLITLLGFEFANLLSGAFIAEYFFNWPGLGRLILKAVFAQDLYLVMASLMMGAVMLIIGNLLADLLLSVIDPRIQLGQTD